jgi:hypothetical protein
MILFAVKPHPESLDVAAVTDSLSGAFSGSFVTSHDAFEAQRGRVLKAIADLKCSGNSVQRAETILGSIDNTQRAIGPAVDISIPMGPQRKIRGQVTRLSVVLRAPSDLSESECDSVLGVLRSLHLGDVQLARIENIDFLDV